MTAADGQLDLPREFEDAKKDPLLLLNINEKLAASPFAWFEIALKTLRNLPGKVDNPIALKHSVELVLTDDLSADAEVFSTPIGFRRRYKLKINSGLYHLLNDVAEITVAQEGMLTRKGERPPDFSPSELQDILKESVIQYVEKTNQWSPVDKLVRNNRERLLRQLRLDLAQRREFSHYGRRFLMTIFVIGHELGHIVLGHCDPSWIFRPKRSRLQEELAADAIGAKFLVDYVSVPPIWWKNHWESTGDFFNDLAVNTQRVWSEKFEYYHARNFGARLETVDGQPEIKSTAYEVWLASALVSVAAFFAIHEAAERAARERGVAYDPRYPPARQRYANFRRLCVEKWNVPEAAFKPYFGLLDGSDKRFENLLRLIEGISWRGPSKLDKEDESTHQILQERAYQLWHQRGRPANDDWADWFRAECELRTRHTS